MQELMNRTPVVLTITSLDPSGCGGISAAVETLASLGCHCSPIVTLLTARDTTAFKEAQITDSSFLIEQIRAVLEDIQIDLINIGDLGSISNAEAVHTILNDYTDIPVVFHPNRHEQQDIAGMDKACTTLLLPLATVTVLNHRTATRLAAGADTLSACAHELMEYGCGNLLISGIPEAGSTTGNVWCAQYSSQQQYRWPALQHRVHGAGATLSAALSAYMAHGFTLAESIQQAQQYTANALQKARRIGMGQLLPDRMHWARK